MIFKFLLLILVAAFLVYLFSVPREKIHAKLFVLFLVGMLFIFILNPKWADFLAAKAGIGRGSDMLLYLAVLLLLFISFQFYLRIKQMESVLTGIVRHIAVSNPSNPPDSKETRDS